MDEQTISRLRLQINVKLDPEAFADLRAVLSATRENQSTLMRRLVRAEAARLGLARSESEQPS